MRICPSRRGTVGYSVATDDDYIDFTWWKELGDISVADVVTAE